MNHVVSIIMAVKDTAPYLAECLESIIAQTYPYWELIAVNDHSSDNTPQILEAYAQKDHRIKVYHSDRERLIPTLKYGYPFCKGPLINRMDSDDRMPIDKLEVMVHEWKKHGMGHVIAGGTEHFRDDGEVGEGFKRYDAWLNTIAKENTYLQEIYRECVIPSHCWLMHKDDLDRIGAFDPEIYPEDYDLAFRIYKDDLRIIGLDKVLHHWRDRCDRISRTWQEYRDNRYFELKLKNFLDLDHDPSRELVLWGAGKNGKDMAKLLISKKVHFRWICENENKIGHDVYGVMMESVMAIEDMDHPQLMIVVASPDGQIEIRQQLEEFRKSPIQDYWFFC